MDDTGLNLKSSWIRALLLLAIIAMAYAATSEWRSSQNEEIWAALTEEAGSIDGLESLRARSRDTAVEPWASYALASELFSQGGEEGNLQRSRQIAEESVAEYPDHTTTQWLRQLLLAVDSYNGKDSP